LKYFHSIGIALVVLFLSACGNNSNLDLGSSYEIEFNVKLTDFDKDVFPEGLIPWVSISNYEVQQPFLVKPDEVVIQNNKISILIDYPLKKSVMFEVVSDGGFTRSELGREVSTLYKNIYSEEESTSSVRIVPLSERKGIINRNETNGKYGIWGHDIEDLDLGSAVIRKTKTGIVVELYIES